MTSSRSTNSLIKVPIARPVVDIHKQSRCRVLYVTPAETKAKSGAREAFSRLQIETLESILEERLHLYFVEPEKRVLYALFKHLFGDPGGVTKSAQDNIESLIVAFGIDIVFIDGSNLGTLAAEIARRTTGVKVITIFQNVEFIFFLCSIRQVRSIKSLVLTFSHFISERRAVKFSSVLVTLNSRDSAMLGRLYGRSADVRDLFAVPVKTRRLARAQSQNVVGRSYCLFVGSAFYANLHGVRWYAKNVAPYSLVHTIVIGRGFDRYASELESDTLTVVGEVESLEPWYEHSLFTVAPILEGSGMKTKVAEALYYGKMVIGTPEAFVGYEEHIERVGRLCLNSADFLLHIRELSSLDSKFYEESLRAIYDKCYSAEALRQKFLGLLGNIGCSEMLDKA